jgi:hypothetical protein
MHELGTSNQLASLVLFATLSFFPVGVCRFRNSEELVVDGWLACTWLLESPLLTTCN